jgi:hypothetical protein
VIIDEEDYDETHLAHYGVLRRSGRYEWGSTNNVPGSKDDEQFKDTVKLLNSKGIVIDESGTYPWTSASTQGQRNQSFLDFVDSLKAAGLNDKTVMKGLGINSTQLRAAKSIAKNERKQSKISEAQRLKDKGLSNNAIGEKMGGLNESSVRALLAQGAADRADILFATAQMLRDQVAEKGLIDVGTGVENQLEISGTRLATAVAVLREEGYELHNIKVEQLGTGNFTNVKVLAPPGTEWKYVAQNKDKIEQIQPYSDDGGRSYHKVLPPLEIAPKRVAVNYKETGGAKLDGVIYVRPGVKDLSLGESRYAQVRISVGPDHYLKGMAMYKEDLPPGIDLVFNTNKSSSSVSNDLEAMKPQEPDPDIPNNPYGATIRRQITEKDADGNDVVTSAMNIVNPEGVWKDWARSISSQVLSKQTPALAKTQLRMLYDNRAKELAEINALTNPAVKKKLLKEFSEGVDASAVHMEAASLTRDSAHHAILPIESMKPTEVYAPNYTNGERVVLIRYPHGGTFEIPELTVNNNQREAKRLLKDARDAIGIHYTVAERLSGADFDGDTVLVIPHKGKIKSTPTLEGLKDFDPKSAYPGYEGMKPIRTQAEMGKISNLITDMTIKQAPVEDIVRAVRHSMVVIDAEKHKLNYKESERVNGIRALKEKYQGGPMSGSSTLISRAGAEVYIPKRRDARVAEGGAVNPVTGERQFVDTGAVNRYADGTTTPKHEKVKRLSIVPDANELSSGTPIERVYADHSNKLKALANQSRLDYLATPNVVRNESAARTYKEQVSSLSAKLHRAKKNRPLERQAQLIGNATYKARLDANPGMDRERRRKVKNQALNDARAAVGAQSDKIVIENDEWDAIQAGAISNSMLTQILDKADLEIVRSLATPRIKRVITPAKLARAQAMFASGYTRAEVAALLGVALGTLDEALYGEGGSGVR